MSKFDASKETRKPQKRFQFIDNSDVASFGSNSTQVRRHVMQEYMREKRWEARTQAENGSSGSETHTRPRKSSGAAKSVPPKRKGLSTTSRPKKPRSAIQSTPQGHSGAPNPDSDVKIREQSQVIEEIPRYDCPPISKGKSSMAAFYLTPQSFSALADMWPDSPSVTKSSPGSSDLWSPVSSRYSSCNRTTFSPEPHSMLSAARTDPFDCLPMTLNDQDQELFDFYAKVMPACSYGFERRNPRAHNWYISCFIPEAMKGAVTFQNTVLVHAANTQAWVKGLAETPLAIEHRARASQMLSEHYQKYPYDVSDSVITATMSAAALEDFDPRPERRPIAWLHWKAAMQKIRDRGGPTALEQSPSLMMLINWSDYIFSGYNGLGSSFYFDQLSSVKSSTDAEAEKIGRTEIAQQCEEFIIFLKCTEQLATVTANLQQNPLARLSQPLRLSMFGADQPLHKLVASPNGPRYTKTGQLKQIISRLAALMTINVAIWEYRYNIGLSEEFFRELLGDILNNDLHIHISVEALIQILLSGSQNPLLQHTERPWLVGRLLKVAKRLGRSTFERLNDFLLQCLTLDPKTKPCMQDWEHELRAEILSAPLVSYVLPLMQG